MTKLKIPSLQHLARNWRDSPQLVKKKLLQLASNPPTFSYRELLGAVRELLVYGTPLDQVAEGIRRRVKRPDIRANFLETLPLVAEHFAGVRPSFVQEVARRLYPIGRGLMVPFDPPLIYGASGKIHFPWFSFWRSNPLSDDRLSLFVTLVEDVLLQDPDLEGAEFDILDFSADAETGLRQLKVVRACDVARLSPGRKIEMLEVFAEGFLLAAADHVHRDVPLEKNRPDAPSTDQLQLF